MFSIDGILKVNHLLPWKLLTAKSPLLIISMPISMSDPPIDASVTLTAGARTSSGSKDRSYIPEIL